MLDKLLKNPSIQKMFLSQLKDLIEKENITNIVISVREGGNFEYTVFKEPIKVLTVKEYDNLINTIQSQL